MWRALRGRNTSLRTFKRMHGISSIKTYMGLIHKPFERQMRNERQRATAITTLLEVEPVKWIGDNRFHYIRRISQGFQGFTASVDGSDHQAIAWRAIPGLDLPFVRSFSRLDETWLCIASRWVYILLFRALVDITAAKNYCFWVEVTNQTKNQRIDRTDCWHKDVSIVESFYRPIRPKLHDLFLPKPSTIPS